MVHNKNRNKNKRYDRTGLSSNNRYHRNSTAYETNDNDGDKSGNNSENNKHTKDSDKSNTTKTTTVNTRCSPDKCGPVLCSEHKGPVNARETPPSRFWRIQWCSFKCRPLRPFRHCFNLQPGFTICALSLTWTLTVKSGMLDLILSHLC